VLRKMLHQAEKPRQFIGCDAFFEQGQDERTLGGAEPEIAVLDPFGNADALNQPADGIASQQGRDVVVRNLRVDGQVGDSFRCSAVPAT
jgi:hypothetical protein